MRGRAFLALLPLPDSVGTSPRCGWQDKVNSQPESIAVVPPAHLVVVPGHLPVPGPEAISRSDAFGGSIKVAVSPSEQLGKARL